MALKRKLTKAQYDKLSDDMKANYAENEGNYLLDVDGDDENVNKLSRAKDRESELRIKAEKKAQELKDQLDEAQAQIDEATTGDAAKKGDIATLEKSWQKKYDKLLAEKDTLIAKKDNFIKETLVDNVAKDIAHKNFTQPTLALPHIKARLMADLEGDTPITRILDSNGKPSAMTVEELSKEFVANKDFAAIVIGSKATGGSASKSSVVREGSTFPRIEGDKPRLLSEMSAKEIVAHRKAQMAAD